MARLLIASRSMALALRLADVHEIVEHSPDELEQLVPGDDVEAVVLDVGDPGVAVDAVRRLRGLGYETPVLLVSGYQHEWSGVASMGLHNVKVVPLPITRVALLEGLTDGVFRYLPDVSVGAGLRRAAGLGELRLGTLALDARMSRPWASQAGFVLTPWLGYQWLRIDADTSLVDFTPGVSALGECGYAGSNVPGSAAVPEAAGAVAASGAPAGTFD